eukprot:TRINITY_DN4637_c0_g1_i2.p2 TRINITY_DN4637_c0_g1~~TRINITY_DN4637_c0_g1_i2.p2  ORF type:complete len:115 (+),score=9.15 TRINITY_DN4637_c0_g1_i2:85-429(+)
MSCPLLLRAQICRKLPIIASLRHAGSNVRLSRGQAKNGTSYGPLTDGPDWSHLETDIPAPETPAQRRRRLKQERMEARVAQLLSEMTVGIPEDSKDVPSTSSTSSAKDHNEDKA